MALDEAMLESVIAGAAPVIRFYTWQPPTLSLGVNQAYGEINPLECAARGFSIVRRLTGGRAVLHHHELTYSVIAPENDARVSGGVVESYRKISTALVRGLNSLGADVSMAPPNPALRQAMIEGRNVIGSEQAVESFGAVCFDAASDYELEAQGRKIVGSAQARRGGAVLQHGSILLDIDWEAWASVFAYRTPEGRLRAMQKLPTRMIALSEHLGRTVTIEETVRALESAFGEEFGVQLQPSEPTAEEWAEARRLAAEKYSRRSWTERK